MQDWKLSHVSLDSIVADLVKYYIFHVEELAVDWLFHLILRAVAVLYQLISDDLKTWATPYWLSSY